ncbi:MAG: hypothetical protein JWL73_521 [Actinomycetia bacterium]|nr:hypothetical protein [Actinomycetes bacterium]
MSSGVDEVRAAIAAYDAALRDGALDLVDAWFVNSAATSRFGIVDVAYGASAIAAARRDPATAAAPPVDRIDGRHELIALGDDVVVATLEHRRDGDPTRRRRTQVWARLAPGQWRIAHAHLSVEQ